MKAAGAWITVVALLACGACASDGGTPPKQQGAQLDLSTSDWQSGDEMMFAQITGVLRVDDQGCLAFEGTGSLPVWPKGFTAYRHDGEVTLYGPEGEVVANEGDTVESGGGEVPVDDSISRSKCLTPDGDMLLVQGEVRVLGD